MREVYTLTSNIIAEIPCLTLAVDDSAEDLPLAVLVHGLGSHKEAMLPTLYAFARRGLRAVAFDARRHGARDGASERDQLLESNYLGVMAEMVEGTSQDVSRLLEGLSAPWAGIHGVSFGGYVAFAAFADEPRLLAASVAMGSPDWLEPLRELGIPKGHPLYEAVAARSPLERAEQSYPPRPLLMLHGDQDDRVSIQGVQELFRRLAPRYQSLSAPLELITYSGAGHEYSEDMIARSADWIARSLKQIER